MTKSPKLPNCHALPNEVAELYKQAYTNKLMLDAIKVNSVVVFHVAPKVIDGRCIFHTDQGCELINKGVRLYGCKHDKVVKSKQNMTKQWLKTRGQAVVHFFKEMMKP